MSDSGFDKPKISEPEWVKKIGPSPIPAPERKKDNTVAGLDQTLAAEGTAVLFLKCRREGNEFIPVDPGHIPNGWLSFTLSRPYVGEPVNRTQADVLVVDPNRFDHEVVTSPPEVTYDSIPREFQDTEGFYARKAEREQEEERLEKAGFMVFHQFDTKRDEEKGMETFSHNLIGIRKKAV